MGRMMLRPGGKSCQTSGGEICNWRPGASALSRGAQRDVKAIGQEGDDAVFKLVVDRAELQIVLEIPERGLDLDELDCHR